MAWLLLLVISTNTFFIYKCEKQEENQRVDKQTYLPPTLSQKTNRRPKEQQERKASLCVQLL